MAMIAISFFETLQIAVYYRALWVCGISAAKSMQNPKKCSSGLPIVIREYIQLITLHAHLSIDGNFRLYGLQNIASIYKNVPSSFLLS